MLGQSATLYQATKFSAAADFWSMFHCASPSYAESKKGLSIIVAITSDEETRNNNSKKIDQATQRIAEKLELDDLFMEAMKTASDLMDADRATLWLIDKVNNELWSKVAIGVPTIRVPLGVGIVGWVTTHKRNAKYSRCLQRLAI